MAFRFKLRNHAPDNQVRIIPGANLIVQNVSGMKGKTVKTMNSILVRIGVLKYAEHESSTMPRPLTSPRQHTSSGIPNSSKSLAIPMKALNITRSS